MPRGKPAIKEIVDGHLHRPGASPGDLEITAEDRLAASGRVRIVGEELKGVHGSFLEMRDGGRVPLHRVVEVRSAGVVVWLRP